MVVEIGSALEVAPRHLEAPHLGEAMGDPLIVGGMVEVTQVEEMAMEEEEDHHRHLEEMAIQAVQVRIVL